MFSRRLKFIVGSVIALIVMWLPLAWGLGSFLEVKKPLEHPDLIYVLAGSADHAERGIEAARLYRDGVAGRIVLTDDRLQGGWNNDLQRNPYFIERMQWLLIDNGVPATAIEVLPDEINGTEDEAKAVSDYICGRDENKVMLVTSAYHARRTLLIFESDPASCEKFIEYGISYPESESGFPNKIFWWLDPKLAGKVIGEYAKLATFYL